MDRKTKRQLEKKGYNTYRFKDNPEELRFVMEWEERQRYGRLIDHLLSDGSSLNPPPASDEARTAANVVIQWLGSPVGQGFLRDLGYSNIGKGLAHHPGPANLLRKRLLRGKNVVAAANIEDATQVILADVFEKQMKKDPDSILPLKKRKVVKNEKRGKAS